MRKLLRIAGLIAFMAIVQSAWATNASGTWKGAVDFQGTSVPLTFHLTTANDGAVTGTVEGLPTTPVEIRDGKVNGDSITFWVNTDYQGQTYKLVYTGKITEGQIAFTLATEDGSWSAQLAAMKSAETPVAAPAPADVTGTWKGAFDFQGTSMLLTIHLSSATGGAVTGTVEGLPTTPAEIHEGKLNGDTTTFWVITDYQGQKYKLVYTGKITAGQIAFTFGTDDGTWSAQLTVTKA